MCARPCPYGTAVLHPDVVHRAHLFAQPAADAIVRSIESGPIEHKTNKQRIGGAAQQPPFPFDFLALLDGDSFVGFMVVQTYQNLAYLFFLAICADCRSKGYGSRAIETLNAAYPDKMQVVDFERPDDTAGNCAQREKRRVFYLGNGYKETGLFLSYLGVEYEVFCMSDSFEPEVFKAMMKTIQVKDFHPRFFTVP